MSKHDEKRKLIKCIRKIFILPKTITVAAMIVSLLCIQSGRADSNISVPFVPINNTERAGGQAKRYSDEVLVKTTTQNTVSEINVSDSPAEKIRDELFTTLRFLQTQEAVRQPQPMKDSTAAELLQRVDSSRSPNMSTVQPLVFAEENLRVDSENLYPINHRFSNSNTTLGEDDKKYALKEIIHSDTHPAYNRAVKHNKMVQNDQSMTGTNNIVAKKENSKGHLKLYDLPYKMRDYRYTEDDSSRDRNGVDTIESENIDLTTSGSIDTWDQSPHIIGNFEYDYVIPPNLVTKDQPRPIIQQKENKINWHTLGLLAFIKLGLVKLQAIGFLNILSLILFKLKMYMTAVFVTFLLSLKLIKLAKTLLLPLIILQLLPTLMQLLSMRPAMNLLGTTRPNQPVGSTQGQLGNILPGGSTQSPFGNILPSGIVGSDRPTAISLPSGISRPVGTTGTGLPSGTTGISRPVGTTGTGLPSGTTGIGRPVGTTGTAVPSGTTGTVLPSGTTGTGQTGGNRLSFFKLNDLNSISKQHNESSMLFDPTLEIFQKVLDSEKCIERIACQIAVAEKAGVIPLWINWIVYHVSTFISSDKLESYIKTYDTVNNDVLNNSTSVENWSTWCLERYKCNSTNNLSNVVNAE